MEQLVLAAAFAFLLAVHTDAAAEPVSTATSPRAAVLAQEKLFRQSRYRVLYRTTYTANFRARCPWSRFLADQRYGKRVLGRGYTLRDVRVRMLSPTRALVAYRFVSGDRKRVLVVTFRDGDLYVKIGRYWYDEYDRVSRC